MSKAFKQLKQNVLDRGLCTHCGTCVGCCPSEAIQFDDILGKCLPVLIGECVECGLCNEVCPGASMSFEALEKRRDEFMDNPMLGKFSKIFIGNSKDIDIRRRGASGGMATEILLQLFEDKEVDGAIVLDFSTSRPWFPEVKVVANREEIIRAAQSKYFIYPQNKILKDIRESSFKKIAYLGLPCQVHGIKKAIEKGVPGTEKIKYILGLYCGNNLYYEATISLLKRFGFKDLNRLKKVAYRNGDYPGSFVAEDESGKKGILDKFTFNYLSFFYTPFRCLFCIDQTNELADLSIGDAWRGVYSENDKEGRSIIVVRNPDFLPFLKQGVREERYQIEEITEDMAVHMHANVLDNKKVGAHARMNIWCKVGKKVPKYFVKSGPISLKRNFFETLNLFVLAVCSQNISRAVVSRIPLGLISPLMKFMRGAWRKRTSKKLGDIKLVVITILFQLLKKQ